MINKYKSHKSENIFLIEWNDIALKSNMEKALFSFFVFITFIFVLIHSLSVFGISAPNSFPKGILRITTDQGYAEYFQYMLLIGTCYFIISIFLIDKKYIFFLPFFIYLLFDDYLQIHDSWSTLIFKDLDPLFVYLSKITTIRIKDFFELASHFIALFFLLFSFIILKFRDNELICFMKKLMFSIYGLIFFAVVVDMLGVKIVQMIDTPKHIMNTLISFLEEAGEMITCSYIFVIFFDLFIRKKNL